MTDSALPEGAASAEAGADSDDVDGEDVEPGQELPPSDDEDWSVERHHIQLMRQLHAAIDAHLQAGEFVPSLELEVAMEAVRGELGWH